jgi:hypothetical protein
LVTPSYMNHVAMNRDALSMMSHPASICYSVTAMNATQLVVHTELKPCDLYRISLLLDYGLDDQGSIPGTGRELWIHPHT